MTSGQGDLRIILLGKTGAGKSATGNTILGRNAFKETSETCEKQKAYVDGKNIVIFDTPGLFNASLTKEQVKAEIERSVEMSAPGPHVFLLVIKLGVRFTEEERNSVQWIQEDLGEEALLRTIILFTHTDQLKGTSLEEYISKSHYLPKIVDRCGGRYHSFNNEERYNQLQITELLEKINAVRRANGMRHYTPEMFRAIQTENTGKDEMMRLNIIHVVSIIIAIGVIFLGFQKWNGLQKEVRLKNYIEQIKLEEQQLKLDIQGNENKMNDLNKHHRENEREEQNLKEKLQKKEQDEIQLENDISHKVYNETILKNKIQEKKQEKNKLRDELQQKEENEKVLKNKIQEKIQLRNEMNVIKDLSLQQEQDINQLTQDLLQRKHEKHELNKDLICKKKEENQLNEDLLQKEQEELALEEKLLQNKLDQHQLKKELELLKKKKQELENDLKQNKQENQKLKEKLQQKVNEKHETEKELLQYTQKV